MKLIAAARFADLTIGVSFCDVRDLEGGEGILTPAPAEWQEEVAELAQLCRNSFTEAGDPEFAVKFGGVMFRVTEMTDFYGEEVFFLRKTQAEVRAAERLGLPRHVLEEWRVADLKCLVIICGAMGHGKTSTAASLIVDRLTRFGGTAIAVEDPPETPLNGQHGNGRCIQVHASRRKGGYREHLIRALRTGADLIFVGEIRDPQTAAEAAQASINGHLILATMHAGSPAEAIERVISLAKPEMPNAAEVLATGLAIVAHQTLHKVTNGGRLEFVPLVLTGAESVGIKQKIREGQTQTIMQDVRHQVNGSNWSGQRRP